MDIKIIDRFLDECGITAGEWYDYLSPESHKCFIGSKNSNGYYVSEIIGNERSFEEMAANTKLTTASREMLVALIVDIMHDSEYLENNSISYGLPEGMMEELCHEKWGEDGIMFFLDFKRKIVSVQKALDKPWQEIKTRLKELKPCKGGFEHYIDLSSPYGIHKNINRPFNINFCPFCGADIREPEPKHNKISIEAVSGLERIAGYDFDGKIKECFLAIFDIMTKPDNPPSKDN